MASLRKLIQDRHKKKELKSLTLLQTPKGNWQASLDYNGKAYAVHVAEDPLEALEYVLTDNVDARIQIQREYRNRDTPTSVSVPDQQRAQGRAVELKKAAVPKGNAQVRDVEVHDADVEDLLG